MTPEKITPEALIVALLDAARKEDWETVNNTLIPQLTLVDSDKTAEQLLRHVSDKDGNIRDVVASSLAPLIIKSSILRESVFHALAEMATKDDYVFAAGRGAAALVYYLDDNTLGVQARKALDIFHDRVQGKGWGQDIKDNIPQLTNYM